MPQNNYKKHINVNVSLKYNFKLRENNEIFLKEKKINNKLKEITV